ncbi:MAG: glycosyltransferase family 4 protein [Candidatus Hydrogenedentales bacterium]
MSTNVGMRDSLNIVAIPRRFVHEDWGGVETYVLDTGRRINAMGHRLEVVCPSILTDVREEDIGGVHVTRTPYFYPYWGLSKSARMKLDKVGGNLFSFSLKRTLKRVPSVDLIHLHTGKRVGGIGRVVAMRRKIPYVITLHGGYYDLPDEERDGIMEPTKGAFEWGKILGWWVESRRVLDDAAAIFCVGRNEQREVQARFPNKRVEYLPNGVDVKRFAQGNGSRFRAAYGISESAHLLVTVARIAPQKNQLLLVKALPELRRKNSLIHVALVGSVNNQDYYDELMRCVYENGVADAVTIVPGLKPEDSLLVDAYHAADVFVLPSVHEPFGIVVLEAWAAGRAVIASRVGGIPDFVDDGINGLLFDSCDLSSFVRAYELLTPEGAQAFAKAGREKVKQYSWDLTAERLVEMYKTVIEEFAESQL